jgi:hypothetical protein
MAEFKRRKRPMWMADKSQRVTFLGKKGQNYV